MTATDWMKQGTAWLAAAGALVAVTACEPEVGSAEWCADMEEKPKGEWTLEETAEFTKSCIVRLPKE